MKNFDMRPKAIIEQLDLLRPIYRQTAAYGHFGRKEFPWESTERANELKEHVGSRANGRVSVAVSKKDSASKAAGNGHKNGNGNGAGTVVARARKQPRLEA
jgi:S-adenosylmethionine synthetase